MDLLGGRKRATHAITRLLFHEMCCTLNGRRRPGLENQHTVQVLISAVFLTVLPAIKWPAVGGEVVPVLLYLALLSTFLGRLVPQLLVPSLVDPLFSLDFEHGLRFGFLLRVGARNCNRCGQDIESSYREYTGRNHNRASNGRGRTTERREIKHG